MDYLFLRIALFDDPEPRSGAMNMAVDEALLGSAGCAVLRVYRWEAEAVSFGYTQRFANVRRSFPGLPLVRRWTGGGIVEHGADCTFSLIIPATEPLASLRPPESYGRIHEAVLAAFRGWFPEADFAAPAQIADGPACFASPRQHDLMLAERKFCGGAQRRTRSGVLHQGSIQSVRLPDDAGRALAEAMANETATYQPESALIDQARDLAAAKYAAAEWNEMR